jgi:PAS domain-containing protein
VSSTYQSRTDPSCKLDDGQETLELKTRSANLALLGAAIGQIDESVVITDIGATIQYVNPGFTRITGYSAQDAVGQNTGLLKYSH